LQATLPLLAPRQEESAQIATDIYEGYAPAFSREALRCWTQKLGFGEVRDGDAELVGRFLTLLQRGKLDFTRSFRRLAEIRKDEDRPAAGMREERLDVEAFDAWVNDYRVRLQAEGNGDDAARARRMNRVNPKYVLRNHLAQGAVAKAEAGDTGEIATLLQVLSRPYDEQPGMEAYAAEPSAELRHIEVGCSS
jgi:uncharacterized protein YdiU (UPF0061 family)